MKLSLAIVLFLIILGSCAEEIIIDKYITKDSIVYVDRILVRVDTFEIRTTVIEKDTVYLIKYDSIFVAGDTLVYHHYEDTAYVFPGRSVYYVPDRYKRIVDQFFLDAIRYNRIGTGGNLLIEPWTQDEAPPDNRSSFSYHVWSQWIIKIKDTLPPEYCFTPLYRELARGMLGKTYTKDTTIMNPAFSPYKLTLDSPNKEEYLKILFAP